MCFLRLPLLSWNRVFTGTKEAQKRRDYLDTVFAAILVESCSKEMAQIAAKVGRTRKTGKVISFSDLLIGVTALHHGYAVGTRNLRHFQMIPNLAVVSI